MRKRTKTRRKPKLYRCADCGAKKAAREFPLQFQAGRWNRERCWTCLDADEDGFVVQLR